MLSTCPGRGRYPGVYPIRESLYDGEDHHYHGDVCCWRGDVHRHGNHEETMSTTERGASH